MNNLNLSKNSEVLDSKSNGSEKNKVCNMLVNFENSEGNLHFENVLDIDPKDLVKRLSDVFIIDVRQPEEFTGELGHIPNSQLMTLDTLDERITEIPKDRTVVFVCRSGGRSARACQFAVENGLTSVYNLKGGMLLWNDLHLPTEI